MLNVITCISTQRKFTNQVELFTYVDILVEDLVPCLIKTVTFIKEILTNVRGWKSLVQIKCIEI